MMDNFKGLPTLPGPAQYQAYVKERLETLSVREGYILAAVLQRSPPRDAEEAVDCLNSLEDYDVCPAGSYEELGKFYLQRLKAPEDILPYVDFEQLGQMYEDKHPGLFIGHCYVAYPKQPSPPIRQENGAPLLWDASWSVKLKLASPSVPEGVWLRLPDYALDTDYGVGEIDLILHELKVGSLDDCTLLESQCILPEIYDLMAQYNDVNELVRDGNNLGHVMDEQGQGEPHWLDKGGWSLSRPPAVNTAPQRGSGTETRWSVWPPVGCDRWSKMKIAEEKPLGFGLSQGGCAGWFSRKLGGICP